MSPSHPTRRAILGGAALGAPALLVAQVRAADPLGPDQPFTLGVASGDPLPDGVVLWTRLAPRPLEPGGGMPDGGVAVRWEVAHDSAFARIARAGEVRADAADGHSVHVEVGGLVPGRTYFYRFLCDGHASPVGRTRTAPAPGAPVERLRLAFASCQNYEVGHYAAWTHVVADNPDLVLFLGDYIYERKPDPRTLRPHLNPEPIDLAGYRVRYATYKLDPQLQAAHAAVPWASTWDDHEVSNDYADQWDERNDDPAWFLRRRAAAYQAYWEHMPLRRAAHPSGPNARLYRAFGWGDMAHLQLIDDRQYRGARACQPGVPGPDGRLPYVELVRDCVQRHDPQRTMLGAAQERWFLADLQRRRARWTVLAQQTLMAPFAQVDPKAPGDGAVLHPVDRWDGFPAARDRIFRAWAAAGTPNPLVLSGDVHAFVAADIRHPDRPDGPPIAAEFVGGSITSLNPHPWAADDAANPGTRFADNLVRGYGLIDLTRDAAHCRFRGLTDARDPASAIGDLKTFTVAAGAGGIA